MSIKVIIILGVLLVGCSGNHEKVQSEISARESLVSTSKRNVSKLPEEEAKLSKAIATHLALLKKSNPKLDEAAYQKHLEEVALKNTPKRLAIPAPADVSAASQEEADKIKDLDKQLETLAPLDFKKDLCSTKLEWVGQQIVRIQAHLSDDQWLKATGALLEVYVPTYLPDGFEARELKIDRSSYGLGYTGPGGSTIRLQSGAVEAAPTAKADRDWDYSLGGQKGKLEARGELLQARLSSPALTFEAARLKPEEAVKILESLQNVHGGGSELR